MTEIIMIRHGATAWNRAKRLQGRADIPLAPDARAALARRRLPATLTPDRWVASPLARARESAEVLAVDAPIETDTRLIEMDWGDWEGETLSALRAADPKGFAAAEARGLDLLPPGGESPRQVVIRLAGWLDDMAATGGRIAAVTHKGVIRAMLHLAVGWDFQGAPPVRFDWAGAHLFIAEIGAVRLARPNIALETRP